MALPDFVLLLVRYLHIVAGVIWVGGIIYTGMVVARTLGKAPPQIRGPAMGLLGPVGFSFLSWAGIATIVLGLANEAVIAQAGAVPDDSWHAVLGVGLLFSIVMLGLGHGVVKPTLRKMAAMGAGPTPPDPAQMAALQKRMAMVSMAGMLLGLATLFLMVYATRMRVT